MIEQSIYFALGCIVTALCALMFAPVFWHRALRLTRQRLQLQIPLSMQEIYAERDQLRAEFAVERLRVEQELERVQRGKAHDMAEIGRRSMEAARFAEQLSIAKGSEDTLGAEVDRLRRDLADRDTDLGQLKIEHGDAKDSHRREMDAAAVASAAAADEVKGRQIEHDDRVSVFERDLATARAALEEAREREKGLHLENSLKAERGRASDRAAAERADALEAENASLRATLQAAQQAATQDLVGADGGLRKSIHDLGLAVAAMTREAKQQSGRDAATREEQAAVG